jgi:sugar lactone lactonase YvrE
MDEHVNGQEAGHIGMYASPGIDQLDSNAADTAGNIYQCIENGARILVWNPTGRMIAKIVVPQDLAVDETVTTNLAIKPLTSQGYITGGGHAGGYIYSFTSLGIGGWESNGGGPA